MNYIFRMHVGRAEQFFSTSYNISARMLSMRNELLTAEVFFAFHSQSITRGLQVLDEDRSSNIDNKY